MRHEIGLELVEVVGHGHALLLATHKGGEAVGNGDVGAENAVDLLLELGGVSRLEEYADAVAGEVLLQSLIAAGAVRIKHVAG